MVSHDRADFLPRSTGRSRILGASERIATEGTNIPAWTSDLIAAPITHSFLVIPAAKAKPRSRDFNRAI